jgi:ATP-dependent DNA helicase RecG
MNFSSILKDGEGTNVEFKEVMNENGYKTISAFSNTTGGSLFCGVTDDGDIVGFDCSDEPVRTITNRIVDKMGIHPVMSCFEWEGKTILMIEVEKSSNPISFNGKYYKRVGTTTTGILGDELREFFLRGSNWDGLTNDYSLDEIDEESVKKFVASAVKTGRMPADETDDISEILLRLNLLIDGKLTNAAIILFGKNPQKYFTNALVRVIKFKDDISISDRIIKGNLFNQVKEAEQAIKNLIYVEYKIKDELTREDIWDYPLDAIREALLNSIVHRDYFKYVIQTQIKISEDQIWFFNPGGLFGGLTVEELKLPHPSHTRNPLIADIFSKSGLVEVYGSGIGRMLNSLKEVGLPEPDFKEEFGGFSLYMFKDYHEDSLRGLGLNERQIKAMVYLYKEGSISTNEYSQLIIPMKSVGTLKRDLNDLVSKNLVEKVGPKKTRRYELIK